MQDIDKISTNYRKWWSWKFKFTGDICNNQTVVLYYQNRCTGLVSSKWIWFILCRPFYTIISKMNTWQCMGYHNKSLYFTKHIKIYYKQITSRHFNITHHNTGNDKIMTKKEHAAINRLSLINPACTHLATRCRLANFNGIFDKKLIWQLLLIYKKNWNSNFMTFHVSKISPAIYVNQKFDKCRQYYTKGQ